MDKSFIKLRPNAGSQINFLTLCPKLNVAIRIRIRDYLQILQVTSSNPGKVVGPVFLGRSNEKLAVLIRLNRFLKIEKIEIDLIDLNRFKSI